MPQRTAILGGIVPSMARLKRLATHKWTVLLGKFLVSAVLIAALARNSDLRVLGPRFQAQAQIWVFAAATATLTQILLGAVRWSQVLRGLGAGQPFGVVLRITFIGGFFNSWLLGMAGGDVVRAMLAPAEEHGRATAVHSVLFDRVAALAGLGLVILPVMALDLGPLARGWALMVSIVIVMCPFAGLYCVTPIARILQRFRVPLLGYFRGAGESWSVLCHNGRRLAGALIASAVSVLAISLTAYCLARAQDLDVSFVDFLILMPPVVLLSSLPVSIGGWGIRETAMVLALAPFGVPASSALLISVQMGLLAAFMSLPGGGFWLVRRSPGWRARNAVTMPLGRGA